jgi:patatin-like phospholipase/acyl hydrolase
MAITPDDNHYRILSLDGGGSWALIEAAALGDIYGLETPGREILKHFHLAIANSGGSLILAGLILDLSPSAILDLLFNEQVRKGIFVKKFFNAYILDIICEKLSFRKYKTAQKYMGLAEAFNDPRIDLPLADIKTQLAVETDIVITAFDYDRERAKFFRSRSDSKTGPSAKEVTLRQAIHASSTAPVKFFDDPADVKDGEPRRFWDGGVGGFNNPVMAGVIETLANYPERRDDIRVLSLGTGNNFLPLAQPCLLITTQQAPTC